MKHVGVDLLLWSRGSVPGFSCNVVRAVCMLEPLCHLICCLDKPHACIFLQMLAPSHRAQVLFQSRSATPDKSKSDIQALLIG